MSLRIFSVLLLLLTSIPMVCQESLGDAARRLRAEKAAGTAVEKPSAMNPLAEENDEGPATPPEYVSVLQSLLASEQFEKLDRMASAARANKLRFPGGGWKLYAIYSTICWEACDTERQTLTTISRLERWISARPNSVTARIALADAYRAYAWNARGTGYADTVDEFAWNRFEERTSLAEATLNEADKLEEKCPQWFLVMQKTARDRGRTLEEITQIVERGTALEPLYYYNYQEFTYTLQPKWLGEEGDSELYAKRIADRIGGKEGDAVYFEIATSLFHCKNCEEANAIMPRVSWPRIQRGYAADEELYGVNTHKLNQFAYLAFRANDHPTASKALERIGNNWDQETWQTRDNFDLMRIWAIRK